MTVANIQEELEPHYSLTKDQIERYRDQGFIKLKDVLSREVLDHYGSEVSRMVHQLNKNPKPLHERDTYSKAFIQIGNLWRQSQTVKEIAFSKRLGRIAAELMGVGGVRMYHDQALYKEPGGGFTPWHADQYYWPVHNDNTTTVWMPLQETPMEMGPLQFAVGSQAYQKGRNLEIGDESERELQKSFAQMNYAVESSPYDVGEVSFHSGWTFHRAGPNTTDRPRAVFTVIYIDHQMRVAQPTTKGQEVDRKAFLDGLEIGDICDTDMTPIIYRAEESNAA